MLLIKEGTDQNKKLTVIQWVKLLEQKMNCFPIPIQAKKTVSALSELSLKEHEYTDMLKCLGTMSCIGMLKIRRLCVHLL